MDNPKTVSIFDPPEQPNMATAHLSLCSLPESPKNSDFCSTGFHSSSMPARSPADLPVHLTIGSTPETASKNNTNDGEKAKSPSPQEKPHRGMPEKPAASEPVVARMSVHEEPFELAKLNICGVDGGGIGIVEESGGSISVGDGGSGRRSRPGLSILRRTRIEEMVKRAAIGFRALGAICCLVSFSVMAANRSRGWALDSFYHYKEFRYSMSVNVIGFLYSAGQFFDLVFHLATGKHAVRHPYRFYFDFAMDQMMSYLLISASSSTTTRIDDWKSNWGEDKFPNMATASVSVSFLAFVALAFSSLISGYALFTSRSLQS